MLGSYTSPTEEDSVNLPAGGKGDVLKKEKARLRKTMGNLKLEE